MNSKPSRTRTSSSRPRLNNDFPRGAILIIGSRYVSRDRSRELSSFAKRNNIKIKNHSLLETALTHRSYVNENAVAAENNERLEFLGDSVLGLAAASLLFNAVNREEGELARIKSFVVSENTLAGIALEMGIAAMLSMGKGEEVSGGRAKKAILADALEAIIGAIYLESGFDAAARFVGGLLVPEIEKVREDRHKKDYKTLLQEYAQKTFKTYPVYKLERQSGPDHDRVFWISCALHGKSYGPASGKNKKEAEQASAKLAYDDIVRIDAEGS